MDKIEEIFEDLPFFGYRRITEMVSRDIQERVNHKRVYRLMRLMGLQAVFTQPNTSKPNRQHLKYPYLLRGLKVERPNQVWVSDITYIRLMGSWVYLVAIMDLHSRKILSWKLSNTMSAGFCVEALEEALTKYGKPEIFNTDQGSQYTSLAFTSVLRENQIEISMDGVGRAIDNVYIERFWRSVKYELIHLNVSQRMTELRLKLEKYIYFYNQRRPHQALRYATPEEAYSELTKTRRGVRSPIWAFTPKDRNCEFDEVSASDIAREYSNI